jgi:putative peptidoglycan lipid II flippase
MLFADQRASIVRTVSNRTHFVGSAKVISALTLVSRFLGLARDMLCSHVFGAGGLMAAFAIGFQIPNLFRRLFGEGALSASSIPVLTDQLHHGGTEAVDRLSGRLLGGLLMTLIGLTVLGELIVLGLRPLLAETERNALTLGLTALLLPYMIPICASAILGGVQNIFGRFAVPAANPIVLNCFMIAALLAGPALAPGRAAWQVYFLAAAVVASGVFQLSWQWASARRCGLRLRLRIDVRDEALRTIARTMLPMTLGLGVVQLNTLLDGLLAYGLIWSHPGGPAVLFYANRLYQFPLGVFAIAVATAIFPALSRHAAANDTAALNDTFTRGLRVVLFEGLPCTIGLILIRRPLIETLFEHGKFDPEDTARVARTLVAYGAGVWAFGLNQIAVRAFYSLKDPRTPMRIAAWMVLLNLTLNLLLVFPLEEAGLALSTTVCAVVQVIWLLVHLRARLGRLEARALVPSAARTLAATAIMAAAVLALDGVLGAKPPFAGSSLLRLVLLTGGGAVAFAGAAWALRSPELREIVRRR